MNITCSEEVGDSLENGICSGGRLSEIRRYVRQAPTNKIVHIGQNTGLMILQLIEQVLGRALFLPLAFGLFQAASEAGHVVDEEPCHNG